MENSDGKKTVITCEPNIGIGNATMLYEHLKTALSEKRAVEIHAGDVAKVDTAILQVFLAFALEAKNANIPVTWASVSEIFQTSVDLLGLKKDLGIPDAA